MARARAKLSGIIRFGLFEGGEGGGRFFGASFPNPAQLNGGGGRYPNFLPLHRYRQGQIQTHNTPVLLRSMARTPKRTLALQPCQILRALLRSYRILVSSRNGLWFEPAPRAIPFIRDRVGFAARV